MKRLEEGICKECTTSKLQASTNVKLCVWTVWQCYSDADSHPNEANKKVQHINQSSSATPNNTPNNQRNKQKVYKATLD